MACPQCGHKNREGARFCDSCGARLAGDSAGVLEERKVVSVLFCDLVGFTASAHAADPEDVSRELARYHAAARREVERFGGVVEKFIGDAVVGVWGAPLVHEDDADRAVRAALAIVEAVDADVRVAVNTGEALVRVGAGADPGFGVVGDVVNTASRLQGVAPVGGVVVGEGTARAVGSAAQLDALPAVSVKGKPEPVTVWRVVAVDGRPGDVRDVATPFVGRATELGLLAGLYERAVSEPALQLVSLVGEPGVGKSRLVIEFERWLAAHSIRPVLRRGRCLAYGDGVGFWPLAEIIKAQAGIGEQDSEEVARAKLELAVAGMRDAAWLRARLAPLVGLPGEASEREQVFTAWRRFFEELSTRAPLVLVVEDIHWADAAMLAFLRHLAEWASNAAMLVICTARPELLEARAGWGGDLVNASTIAVRPLKEAETERLARLLLARFPGSIDPETLVERCGGNPLYAEEYARLLGEQIAGSELAMPDSLHALIAARIDTLSAPRKALLQDAAVIGKVFWAGAVAAIGGLPVEEVRVLLHDLARKELVRVSRVSTMPGDEEYVFWHDLVHEVAYQGIPRGRRADLHAKAGEWIEHAAGDRRGDRAELVAHHYRQALELRLALGDLDVDLLRRRLVGALGVAAETALNIDASHAWRLATEALTRASADDPQRGRLLCLAGTATLHMGELEEAASLLGEARTAASEGADWALLGECYFQLLETAYFAGEGDTFDAIFRDALADLAQGPTTSSYAMTLTNGGFIAMQRGHLPEAMEIDERALAVATATGDTVAIATALNVRALVRSELGDRRAFADLQVSHDMFEVAGSSWTTMAKFHLGYVTTLWDGPEGAKAVLRDAVAYGDRLHDRTYAMFARVEELFRMDLAGEWDALLALADEVIGWAESAGAVQHGTLARSRKARVLALRGQTDDAAALMEGVLERARRIGDLQALTPTLATHALILYLGGQPASARRLLHELTPDRTRSESPVALIFRLLVGCGDADGVASLLGGARPGPPRLENNIETGRALLLEQRGALVAAAERYRDVAQRWRRFGDPYELAHALAGQARTLQLQGRDVEAKQLASESVSLFDRLGVCEAVRLMPTRSIQAAVEV
jgi:class 3 adenylate cyclase/tetratricopeptide (TPR) repeat protein